MNNFCFIVPFRATEDTKYRNSHLMKFVRHYKTIFPNVPIYVIDQLPKHDETTGDKWQGFMRGRLLNIGFLEFGQSFDYAAYHDVDMYVMTAQRLENMRKILVDKKRWVQSEGIDAYRYPDNPTHICTRASQFSFRLPYPKFMGGITLFATEQFKTFGGYSNQISSYGNEDDDLYNAVTKAGYTIDRRECYIDCEEHKRLIIPAQFHAGRKVVNEGRLPSDNLENTQYEVVDMKIENGYTRLTVDLEYFEV